MTRSQQPGGICPVLGPFTLALAAPPSGAMLLYELPSGQLRRSFLQKLDDERLRAIISRYAHPPISQWEWHQIAAVFGRGVTVRQIPERWHDYARPGLDPGPFSISERGQVAALAIDHPHDRKWIASQLGDGQNRSAAMVKQCAHGLLPKLASLGFDIRSSGDVALVPDAAFAPASPKGHARMALLAEYRVARDSRTVETPLDPRQQGRNLSVRLRSALRLCSRNLPCREKAFAEKWPISGNVAPDSNLPEKPESLVQ